MNIPPPVDGVSRARALFDYTATDESEVSFTKNTILYVHVKDESGWWEVETTGEGGGKIVCLFAFCL